jgi:4-hydroxyphenylacetate 3-monooxygenase
VEDDPHWIRDQVYINGEKVPGRIRSSPLVDIRARIFDMAHDPATRDVMTVTATAR